jgi:poly(3-hydroxybutyrate) depolymerase
VQFGELDVDGQVRRYRVFAPPSIEEGAPAPLVLARVLDELGATYPIDSDRVFAVGASNGAIMAYRLACELPDRITGVAAVGGAMRSTADSKR